MVTNPNKKCFRLSEKNEKELTELVALADCENASAFLRRLISQVYLAVDKKQFSIRQIVLAPFKEA